jgi:hypothetical protein
MLTFFKTLFETIKVKETLFHIRKIVKIIFVILTLV